MKKMSRNSKKLVISTMLASAAFVVPSGQARAQSGSEATSESVGNVIIVTARKREESLQDVPIAITAISDDELRESNSVGLEDVAQSTPGLTFQESAGVSSPTIRGLSQTDLGGFINNVGVFVDGVYLNSRSSLEFANLDLQRVEVLKGPQSALYGRDTFAGAINYVTRKPDLGEFNGRIEATIGSGDRYGAKGSLNIPIGEGVAVRLFGGHSEFDGTIDNVRGGEKLGGYDKRQTMGASVLLQPVDGMRINAFFVRNEVNEDQPPLRVIPFTANNGGTQYTRNGATFFSTLAGDIPTFDNVDIDPRGFGNDGHLNLGYVNIEMDLPFATFSGNYSYSESEYRTQFDNSGDATAATRPILPFPTPFSAFFFTNQSGDVAKQQSVEVKFTSRDDSDVFWLLGGSYYDITTGSTTASIASLLADPTQLQPITNVPQSLATEAFAAYAALTVPIGDRFNIGGEIRYTDESQQQMGRTEIFFIPGFPTTVTNATTDFDYWTGRVTADFKVTDDVLVYAYAARGVKAGGVNPGFDIEPSFRFSPETNWTYELGLKSEFLDGRAVFNAALFYIDWQNVQVRAPATLLRGTLVTNGSGATSKGVEIDATFRVTDNFTLRTAASYTDPSFDDDFIDRSLNGACAVTPPPAPTVVVNACSTAIGGNQLPRTSKFQFFGSATYEIPDVIGDFGFYARGDFSHRGNQFATSLNNSRTGTINLANARLGLRNDSFDIALWVDNLLDDDYNARVLQSTGVGTPVPGLLETKVYPGNGRTFGLTGLFRF